MEAVWKRERYSLHLRNLYVVQHTTHLTCPGNRDQSVCTIVSRGSKLCGDRAAQGTLVCMSYVSIKNLEGKTWIFKAKGRVIADWDFGMCSQQVPAQSGTTSSQRTDVTPLSISGQQSIANKALTSTEFAFAESE